MEPSEDKNFDDFLSRNKVNLNRLLDKERNIRLRALKEFNKACDQEDDAILWKFWKNHLFKPLVLIYDDQIEKLRCLAIEITTKMVEKFDLEDEAQAIIPGIIVRMNKIPFQEPSEEVRIEFLQLLDQLLDKNADQFVPQLTELAVMLSKIILDNNPEMKNQASSFCIKLCSSLPDKCGYRMKRVVISLTENLKHQHSKVRKNSLNALKIVIGWKGAEDFLSEWLPQLKMTMNDRHHDVRRVAIRVIDHWLKNMDIHAIKKFEKDLLLFLLNGVSDEVEEIQNESIEILERHGNDMKEALAALGEAEEDKQSEEAKDVEMKIDSQS